MDGAARRDGGVEVCLVSMPYANLSLPSIGLGLLSAQLKRDDITVRSLHANLLFAEQIGLPRYQLCAAGAPSELLAGEWTFRPAAFPEARDPVADQRFLSRAAGRLGRGLPAAHPRVRGTLQTLRVLQACTPAFVDDVARRVLATGARIVGCTSTFEQHVASLALLRRVRELDPSVVTMLGGANCETEMGAATHENFDWVDFVVSGEADGIIAPLVRRVLDDGPEIPVHDLPPGVLGPAHRRVLKLRGGRPMSRALFRDLDSLPCPDYVDYFEQLAGSSLCSSIRPGVPLETSRGCWWGAKHQCTFCGLNGSSMAYHAKSAQRVLDDIHALESRHGIQHFEVVDNILDTQYFGSVLPALADEGEPDRDLFFEVKANLSRPNIGLLVDAGVRWVQPGIESLDTDVLRIMDKGIQGWQNVRLLKWAHEYGLRVSWSLLWGFPGEPDEAYVRMARLMPLLEHLQPPAATAKLRYDRYSVYHKQPAEHGLVLSPVPSMRDVYPVPEADLARLAYFFVDDVAEAATPVPRPGVDAVKRQLVEWRSSFATKRARLEFRDDGRVLTVTDTRAMAVESVVELVEVDRALVLATADGTRAERLPTDVRAVLGVEPSADEIDRSVNRLLDRGLVASIDHRLLGLTLPESCRPLPELSDFPGGQVSLDPDADDPLAADPVRRAAAAAHLIPVEPRPDTLSPARSA